MIAKKYELVKIYSLDTELVGLSYLRVLEYLTNSVVDNNELMNLNKFCNGLFHLTHLLNSEL